MARLAELEGRWQVVRRIDDRRAGLVGHFEGEAVWCPDADGLRQLETGVLRYGDAAPMQASRVYLWRQDGDGLAVFFEDGRPFHRVGPERLQDRHLCDPDIYDVRYDLSAWPDWVQDWIITGPRKDMRLVSRFSRPKA